MLQRAHMCQASEQNPHENIARYPSCIVSGGRIVGLTFEKCDMTLRQVVEAQHDSVDRRNYLKGIKQEVIKATKDGLEQPHRQNLVHGDVTVDNLMSKGSKWKIIDFESCCKRGTCQSATGWAIQTSSTA
jgi:hypothetical protein